MSRFVEISHDLWRIVIDFYLPSQAPHPPWLMWPMYLLFTITIAKTIKKTDEIFDKNLHIKNHISKVGK